MTLGILDEARFIENISVNQKCFFFNPTEQWFVFKTRHTISVYFPKSNIDSESRFEMRNSIFMFLIFFEEFCPIFKKVKT